MTRPSHAILIAIVIVLLVGLALVTLPHLARSPQVATPVATTTQPVVTNSDTADWQTFDGPALSFKYPAHFPTTYIHETDWPPKAAVTAATTTCAQKANEMGQTALRTIAGASYCVTMRSEGAAGSTYTTYTYATQKDTKTVALTFTTRAVQCGNYDEPQMSACTTERQAFSIDDLAAKMLGTVTLK